jgi:hypothetical protein
MKFFKVFLLKVLHNENISTYSLPSFQSFWFEADDIASGICEMFVVQL